LGSDPICWQKGPHLIAPLRKWLRRISAGLALVLLTILAVRAFDAWRAPPLSLWHTEVPGELNAAQIDAADWTAWLFAEQSAFHEVRTRVTDKLPAADQVPANRYFAGSPMHGSHFTTDWNRSFLWMPEGESRGAVVLLHGLTDSPYSLRHVGAFYLQQGFVVVGARMPGHGTVPAGLARVSWRDWLATTRLSVRHARALAGGKPLHIVGYSNGAALALKYALDALQDEQLAKPDQLVLFSPMVGISSFARYSGVLGWPAVFPAFSNAAWLDTVPEYNPFKYNSFPVNGARQSAKLVDAVQQQMLDLTGEGALGDFPRVLAFQSLLDSTVFTAAVADNLFKLLPENGSELVLFDRNHAAAVGPLVRLDGAELLAHMMASPRQYRLIVVSQGEARVHDAGSPTHWLLPLAGQFPDDMYSLSHVALPFPVDDALYGLQPRADEFFGVHLGTVAVRGERGALVVPVENLMRATSNPFFGFELQRIAAQLAPR
jgi:alpha-beta hydrolase superfamily lysophospholipase